MKTMNSTRMAPAGILTLVFLHLVELCTSYKPVFVIHGILSQNVSMKYLEKRIKEVHPTTEVYVSNRYGYFGSLEPMWIQVEKFGSDLMSISSRHPEGVHLIGYSQGGLIARAVLERFSDHNVKTFISLSSPQAGQYGTKFLHLLFPDLLRKTAYKVFYTDVGQWLSVGNYWNDPHNQDLYYNFSVFLPFINNEIPNKRSPNYTKGLLKLEKMILIGGPEDEIITPWQSSIFGFYDSNETVVKMEDRQFYKDDFCGLKTLQESNKLKLIVVDGVRHLSWRKNQTVIDNYILPYLD